jgi:hypothetical protein
LGHLELIIENFGSVLVQCCGGCRRGSAGGFQHEEPVNMKAEILTRTGEQLRKGRGWNLMKE